MTSSPRILHAATGSNLTAKGWAQEAAIRMLHNNLDPAVAEHPEKLVVYGGTGKAARNWPSFDAIVKSLTNLDDDVLTFELNDKTGSVRAGNKILPAPATDWATTLSVSGRKRLATGWSRSGKCRDNVRIPSPAACRTKPD